MLPLCQALGERRRDAQERAFAPAGIPLGTGAAEKGNGGSRSGVVRKFTFQYMSFWNVILFLKFSSPLCRQGADG